MERVAFLIESTGQRIGCLLNPESLVRRRTAGIRVQRGITGTVAGQGLADDRILYTGGGATELLFDLVFDVSIAGSTITTEDVRDLTGPLWDLAENVQGDDAHARPPLARFLWGKSWNILGIVASVAERLEHFNAGGVPRRSWLRMRFFRVSKDAITEASGGPTLSPDAIEDYIPDETDVQVHRLLGQPAEGDQGVANERLDQLAFRYFGDASLWKALARLNGIVDPLRLEPGQELLIPKA
jgi:hypothetical protein